MLVRVIALESVLVSVTVWGELTEPGAVLLKETEVGEKSTGPTTPLPLRPTCCEPLGASSITVTWLVRVPWAKGRNAIEMVQEPPAATVPDAMGQVVAVSEKSEPSGSTMPEMVSGTDWLLVRVVDLTLEVWPI